MTRKHYTKTQDMTYPDTYNELDSLDACTFGGLYCSTEPIANEFYPTTHKVSLKRSKSSYYLYHLS